MADDIDIEEHDILESLRRRQPDAVVKTEPPDADYMDSQYGDIATGYHQSQWGWPETTEAPQIKVEPAEEEFQFGKIILGTKPPIEPPEQLQDAAEITRENYNYNMSLVLDDWGPILEKSSCYCPDCQILFATVNALDAHKMVAHSFLIPTEKEASPERNKAIKSTAKSNDDDVTCEICKYRFKGHRSVAKYNLLRHYKDIHKVDPSTDDLRNWKICNHCNVYFPSDTALVKHLYELLPLNDKKTPTKEDKKAPVKAQSAVKSTTSSNVKAKTPTAKPVQPVTTYSNVNSSNKVKSAVKNVNSIAVVNTERIVKPVQSVATCSNNIKSFNKVKNVNSIAKKENSLILETESNVDSENNEKQNNVPNTVRKCEVCGIDYCKKYYLIHMRKFHPDFLLMKMGKLKKMPANSTISTTRYKCTICRQVLVGRSAAKRHRLTKHPQMGGQKILKLVKTHKVKAKPKLAVKKEPQTEESVNLIVSKSTLFKCNRCSVHFLTCYGACAHSRVCETSSNLRDWSCPQCQRVFKNTDKKAHEFQHKNFSSKFKVYVVYLEMVVRILCECPICYVCFEEYKFWRHVNFGCEKDAESFYCNECRLPIDASSRNSHESKHMQGDFTKEDFIKVDFVSSRKEFGTTEVKTEIASPKKVTPLKRKTEEIEVPNKKRKREECHLYYCPTCKCYSHIKAKFHIEKKCKELVFKNGFTKRKKSRLSCRICALSFNNRAFEPHKKLHEKYPNLTLSDLIFTRLTDDKRIKPVPEHFPCKICQVTFTTNESKCTHKCGSTNTTECKVCQKKLERQSFAAHMRFHTYVIPSKEQLSIQKATLEANLQTPNEIKSNLKRNEAVPMKQNLPELLMKYKSLTTLWNILYLCDTCETYTDSYDKVVEHCQNHFTNMESYGVVIMKCQICNMKFDRECYRRHLELHAGSKVISRKSFKILTYDHSKIFSPDWLSFMDLPEDQKTQILNRSIYGEARSVRLKLVQQGPPEYTVYRCVLCLKCVAPDALTHHINLQNCLKAHKIVCSFCDMIFVNRGLCDQHEKLHETTNLEAASFRIIAFNDSITEFNEKDVTEESKREILIEDSPESPDFMNEQSKNVKTIKGKKFYMFYKCGGCDVCMLSESSTKKHVCTNGNKRTCNKCGLKFTCSNYVQIHEKFHAKFDFTEKNVFTKTFNNNIVKGNKDVNKNTSSTAIESVTTQNDNKDVAKLYKCHCGLHYTSLKSIEKHYQVKNCSLVVREKCSQCNLIFDPLEIVNHLCKHHAQVQFKNFDIIMPTKKTLYKCNQCHVLFYDSNVAIIHKGTCQGMASGTKCLQCGLAFHRTSIEKHRDDHKAGAMLKPDCYVVVDIPNDQTKCTILFKCKKCDVNFLLRTTLRNHIAEYNHRMVKVLRCKECGLKFSKSSLPKHIELHHVKQKVVDFEFRYVNVAVKNKPKIEEKAVETTKKEETEEEESEEEETEVVEVDNDTQLMPVKDCQVYKCKKCSLHFMDENTLINHNGNRCSKELSEVCDICDIKFASRNMKEHRKEHGDTEMLNISVVEDVETTIEETDENQESSGHKLYKCHKCELHFNNKKSLKTHLVLYCNQSALFFKCDECGLNFTRTSLARHRGRHPKGGFEIVTLTDLEIKRLAIPPVAEETQIKASNSEVVSLDSSFELESTDSQDKAKVKLYKCGDCNVYFLTQRLCYKHVIKHTAMDAKDYIECKLCGFQFTIMALQSHIKKHHAVEFNLEEVLIEDYKPNDLTNNVPKIEIYYAIDKYQSRLVSTTSDVKNDSQVAGIDDIDSEPKKAEDEVTSNCNELTEKIDANQNDSQIVVDNQIVDVVANDLKVV